MEIKGRHHILELYIDKARRGQRDGQKYIYDTFAPLVLGVIRRYISDIYHAEDVMITVFVKIYKNLHTYEATGSFEGWIRRIASFESISFIRSQKRYSFVAPLDSETSDMDDVHMETNIDLEYLHWMLSQIPEGCRTIFMLYAVDGYKHQEIAEMLNISEGTSKSQVAYARKLLKILLSKEKIV